jgi:aspartyl-tRNA(Asn)/glutamyl-tRNA(Gln) amidotransferase subunit A
MFLAIKDNICYQGHIVSGGSQIIANYQAVYTSTALQRLLDEDAILIGRCNCDEFAMGASNENSSYGPVKNAADKSRVPGGSSGGSAVAVQADMCLAALGSDTGGSIRQPASFTGTIGLKPTYGRVSRYGLLAYASSFDQIGPITSSTSDAELIIQIMAGKDEMDATSSSTPVQKEPSLKPKLKIAIVKEAYHGEGLDPEVKSAMDRVFRKLREMGHVLEEVSYPNLKYMVPCYYVLTTAEASSNLSRYSGILYGHRSETAVDIDTTIKKSRTEGFGEEVKRRIMTGTFVLSEDFYEAYYNKAQKVRALIKSECEETLKEYDFVISPTAPTTAFKLGDKTLDPIQMYLADIFTVQASLAGLPAVSIPVGKDKHNLPIGLQIMGNAFEESSILKFADVILG